MGRALPLPRRLQVAQRRRHELLPALPLVLVQKVEHETLRRDSVLARRSAAAGRLDGERALCADAVRVAVAGGSSSGHGRLRTAATAAALTVLALAPPAAGLGPSAMAIAAAAAAAPSGALCLRCARSYAAAAAPGGIPPVPAVITRSSQL